MKLLWKIRKSSPKGIWDKFLLPQRLFQEKTAATIVTLKIEFKKGHFPY